MFSVEWIRKPTSQASITIPPRIRRLYSVRYSKGKSSKTRGYFLLFSKYFSLLIMSMTSIFLLRRATWYLCNQVQSGFTRVYTQVRFQVELFQQFRCQDSDIDSTTYHYRVFSWASSVCIIKKVEGFFTKVLNHFPKVDWTVLSLFTTKTTKRYPHKALFSPIFRWLIYSCFINWSYHSPLMKGGSYEIRDNSHYHFNYDFCL